MRSSREQWLECGYRQFAELGPEQLSINQISKEIGASRASFYHHFGETDFFIQELLSRHWQICKEFDEAGRQNCRKLVPDLYLEMAKHPVPLRFHIQLFHHRNNPAFNFLFINSYESSARAFALQLFADHFKLRNTDEKLFNLWLTLGEAWYSRLDPEDLSAYTLQTHGEAVLETLAVFIESQLFITLKH